MVISNALIRLSNPKQPSHKKVCGRQECCCKKDEKSKECQPRNGCDGRLKAQFLIKTYLTFNWLYSTSYRMEIFCSTTEI